MENKQSYILFLLISFLSGFALMSMELVYPRISIIWFGNVLTVWAIDLSMSLVIIAIGYRIGSWLISRKKGELSYYLLFIYLFAVVYLIIINLSHKMILEKIALLDVVLGSILFSLFFMLPTMGLLAVSGPLLVQLINTNCSNTTQSTAVIFGTSTMGGAIAMLVIGLYSLPHLGISITIYFLISLLIINILFVWLFQRIQNN